VKLYHVWLAKRELETRRVRSRPFTGINPSELDLKHGHGHRDQHPDHLSAQELHHQYQDQHVPGLAGGPLDTKNALEEPQPSPKLVQRRELLPAVPPPKLVQRREMLPPMPASTSGSAPEDAASASSSASANDHHINAVAEEA
jgi:hypothetical protein